MINLMIVEDEVPLVKKMTANVDWAKNGYQVFTSTNGGKALQILRDKYIEILVTDIKMPGMSGIELIKKSKKICPGIIPIIISGYAEFEYAQASIRLNVSDYILKPFRSFRLLEVVEKARERLEKKREEQRELKRMKREVNRLLSEVNIDYFAGLLLTERKTEFYKEQAVVFQNENIFKDLRISDQDELLSDIDDLIVDMRKASIDHNHLLIILHNIVLLTFKNLKEMGYEIRELVYLLEVEVGPDNPEEINLNKMETWLKGFFINVNNFITNHKQKEDLDLVKKVKNVINKKFSEGITLSELASQFHVSSSYLSRLFYKETGKKFSKYLDHIRVNKARELLKTTDYRIYQIAFKIGFDDPYYFSSWFKKKVGISPTTYRENISLIE